MSKEGPYLSCASPSELVPQAIEAIRKSRRERVSPEFLRRQLHIPLPLAIKVLAELSRQSLIQIDSKNNLASTIATPVEQVQDTSGDNTLHDVVHSSEHHLSVAAAPSGLSSHNSLPQDIPPNSAPTEVFLQDSHIAHEAERLIDVVEIVVDRDIQPRKALDPHKIAEYADQIANGEAFPPIVLFKVAGDFLLADGFHRVEAAKRAKVNQIRALIRQGSARDAACSQSVRISSTAYP